MAGIASEHPKVSRARTAKPSTVERSKSGTYSVAAISSASTRPMAAAVANGEADLAIGTERISRQMEGLGFIPLMEERFDFVIKKELMATEAVQKLLKVLNSPEFRREVAHFSGNDYRDLGKIICEV